MPKVKRFDRNTWRHPRSHLPNRIAIAIKSVTKRKYASSGHEKERYERLAKQANLDYQTIISFVKDQILPTPQELIRLSEALEISIECLIGFRQAHFDEFCEMFFEGKKYSLIEKKRLFEIYHKMERILDTVNDNN